MFEIIKKTIGKVKSLILRVPDGKKLGTLFDNGWTIQSPVVRKRPADSNIDFVTLKNKIDEIETAIKDLPKVVEKINLISGFDEYKRQENKARPKIKTGKKKQ